MNKVGKQDLEKEARPGSIHGKSRVKTLDFLRGLAILAVISVHIPEMYPPAHSWIERVCSQGKYGVQLFFFVSALTMCHMWIQRSGEPRPVLNFYIRRVLRIAPLFLIAILVYMLLYGPGPTYWAPEGIGLRQIVLTASFLHTFWPDSINSVVPGGWSIGVEMLFYLFFPLLIILFKDNPTKYLLLAICIYFLNAFFFEPLIIEFLKAHTLASSATINKQFLYFNFINQCPIFLLGCFLFFSMRDGFKPLNLSLVAGWLAAAAAVKLQLGQGSFMFLIVYCTIGCGVVLAMMRSASFGALESIGQRSYTMYLIHFLVLEIFVYIAPVKWVSWVTAVSFVLTIIVSYFSAKVIDSVLEVRLQQLARKLTKPKTA